ncbi:MAG: dephospho-CoA kinase [Acidobacteriota bacterium]
MLRVGLTGDLGSGKSTVAKMLAERGAVVLSSDEMARAMMQPGEAVYREIVERFGPGVVAADGSLDRRELARLAFDAEKPRVEELNAIVHPAVIGAQAELIGELAKTKPDAIVVVESALVFSAQQGSEPWRGRFDCVVVVTAPEEMKVARFVERVAAGKELSAGERAALEADARKRLAVQHEAPVAGECFVVENDDGVEELEEQVVRLMLRLRAMAAERRD